MFIKVTLSSIDRTILINSKFVAMVEPSNIMTTSGHPVAHIILSGIDKNSSITVKDSFVQVCDWLAKE
jgi:hypothetical protein